MWNRGWGVWVERSADRPGLGKVLQDPGGAAAADRRVLFFRVTGEVKHNPTNTVTCKIQGEWNSVLEFTSSSGDTRCVDLTTLPVTRKRVRPLEKQGLFESR